MKRVSIISTLAVGVVFVAIGMGASFAIQRTIEHKTIEVQSKERLMSISTTDEGKSKTSYQNFVYSDDETYVVQDSFWNWHFRAATVYAKIPDKGICEVTLSGVRWGFLSMYQNIIVANCN